MVRSAIGDYWNLPPTRGEVLWHEGVTSVAVDPLLTDKRLARHLKRPDGTEVLELRQDIADAFRASGVALDGIDSALEWLASQGHEFADWEYVFYLTDHARAQFGGAALPEECRVLTEADAELFAAFQAGISEDDLDEAFVELDHWLVLGAMNFTDGEGETIMAASSVYPWDGTTLADVGIVTSPAFRGRGLARTVVRAAAIATLAKGYEPQYRCQLTNTASKATGEASGFELFATWRVVTGEAPSTHAIRE